MIETGSSLKTWQKCKRLYLYKYIRCYRPVKKKSAYAFGSAFHVGLEHFFSGSSLDAVLTSAVAAFSDDWLDEDTKYIEIARLRAMLQAYCAVHANTLGSYKVKSIEREFEYTDNGMRIAGKIDAEAYSQLDRKVLVIEHKTTSDDIESIADDYWQRLAMDSQIVLYARAAEFRYNKPVVILYDVAKKPKGKPKSKKVIRKRKSETEQEFEQRKAEHLETISEFESRLLQEMLDNSNKYLVRRKVNITRSEQQAVLSGLKEVYDEISDYNGVYPMNEEACFHRFGKCQFFDVCIGVDSLYSPNFEKIDNRHPELSERDIMHDCPL